MASSPPQGSPPSPPPDSSSSPPPSSSSSSPPPPKDSSPPPSSSPPPKDSSPPASSPPPPKDSSSPPPPKDSQSSPPPPSQSSSPPPSNSSPPKDSGSPPPPSSTTPSPPNRNPTPTPTPSPPPPSASLSPPKSSTNSTKAPPPPHAISPPSSKTPSSSSSSGSSSSISSEAAIIIGVTVGVGLLIALVMVLLCLVCSKKKKKRSSEYYMENGNKGGDYYNNNPNQYWQKSNKPEYMIPSPSSVNDNRLPPPPGSAPMDNGGNWPSPSLVVPTGDGSSSFSGPGMTPLPPPNPAVALGFSKSTFTYDELAAATGGFSRANLLGQGGFGYVHKGVLPSGKEIAVKSLKSGSGQGEREFQAEVEIISRVHHRHLVSLVGYCIAGGQRMLVYEFVPNNNLEHHLHGKNTPSMDWSTRLKIALGSAKGLAYLHEDCHPRIIHRDIKTANILIDNTFEAKVADFGLAKLSEDTSTHVSTRIMGTFGYLAPEYASSGKLTEKSDVFSYGVMLLELITGRRPVDLTGEYDDMEDSLVEWARPIMSRALDDGNYDELVDPRLGNNYDHHEMTCMVACAAASVRHSARRRPKMSQVARALEGEVSLEYLNEGVKPGQSTVFSSNGSTSDYDASSYSADMKKFRKMALGSQEYTSSEYGATSEYGLNPSCSCSSSDSVDIHTNKH